jgi:CheY-like chemotaxis protein
MGQQIGVAARKVVSIEDDPGIIDLFRLILKPGGYEVLGATSGQRGLELVQSTRPDIVLLDLTMPGMDGWEVYQHMKADEVMRDIPVIVVTCRTSAIDELLARNIAKVDDYIPKPFGPSALIESVERVLSSRGRALPN